ADDPVAFFARGRRRYGECTYWERPARGFALVGAGVARVIAPTGPRRFQEAAAALRDDRATAVIDGEIGDGTPGGPIYLGGFAFDPDRPATPAWDGYPAGRLVLPRFLLTVRGEVATLTMNALIEPGSDPASAVEGTLRDLAALSAPPAPAPNGAARTLATEEFPS